MLLQPKNETEKATKIQEKIKLLKRNLKQEGKSNNSSLKKNERSTQQQLNTEYEKLDQLRSEQSHSLQNQWETYKNEQRQYRKKDIEKRQVEFDKELSVLDNKRRQKWKNNDSLEDLPKNELSRQLLKKLEEFDLEQVETNTSNSILRLPTDFLELFWLLEIDMPITKAEILEVTDQIKKKLKV